MAAVSDWQDFDACYGKYSQSVYRRALQLLGDSESARDATQEVFLRVIRSGGQVPPEPTPTSWLYRVTTNLCLNRLRDQRRQKARLAETFGAERSVTAAGDSRVIVTEILSRMPEELQDIAVYFFLDELTYDEIAPLMGLSRRTISNRLAAFREVVARMFPEERLAAS